MRSSVLDESLTVRKSGSLGLAALLRMHVSTIGSERAKKVDPLSVGKENRRVTVG